MTSYFSLISAAGVFGSYIPRNQKKNRSISFYVHTKANSFNFKYLNMQSLYDLCGVQGQGRTGQEMIGFHDIILRRKSKLLHGYRILKANQGDIIQRS